MASIDLPRTLRDYFAFAETTPTRNGRRFSITLPYRRQDGRLDRLQWWYHLSAAKEMALGDNAADTLRAEAIERFVTHIERWLQNTRQDLYGDGSIPYVSAEGNRLVGAYQVDPSLSDGLEATVEEDPPEKEAGDDPPESSHHPTNQSAFG